MKGGPRKKSEFGNPFAVFVGKPMQVYNISWGRFTTTGTRETKRYSKKGCLFLPQLPQSTHLSLFPFFPFFGSSSLFSMNFGLWTKRKKRREGEKEILNTTMAPSHRPVTHIHKRALKCCLTFLLPLQYYFASFPSYSDPSSSSLLKGNSYRFSLSLSKIDIFLLRTLMP